VGVPEGLPPGHFRDGQGKEVGSMKRIAWAACLVGFVLVFSVPSTQGEEKVRGVTDKTIKIGQWGPQTGPAAAWGAVARGTDLYFKLINDEGGIHGRKIEYYLRDDAYNPAKTKAIGKEFINQIGVFAVVGGVGTACGMAVRDDLIENRVVWVAPSTGSKNWSRPFQKYIFAVYPLYVDEAYLLTKYAVEQMGKKRIAVFYQNDDYGKDGLEGVEKYLKSKGMEIAAKVSVEVPDTDLSSHALKLKESGADAVIMYVLPKHGAIILGEAAKLGFSPQWISSSTLSDAPLMFDITKGLWKGVIVASFGELPDSDHPLMVKYRKAWQKYAPKERWGIFYYAGIIWAEPLVEGLKRAGRNLTTESLISAMETFKEWKGIGPPLTYTSTDHLGAKSIKIARVKDDGNLELLSDWIAITE
jgi:branched-chain amino acid transport system substrate-binding protein